MSEAENKVIVQRLEDVGVIRINRPEVRNVIDADVASSIERALDEFEEAPEVRAIVLTGEGDKAFSAGMDLRAFTKLGPRGGFFTEKGGFAGVVQRAFQKPFIVAANGLAMGGGMEIILAADCTVAAQNATFALPEVKVGMHAGGGGVIRLAKRIPRAVALEMVMSGDQIGAERAHQLGLVNTVTPIGGALDVAIAMAQRIAAASPTAVTVSRRLLLDSLNLPEEDGWDLNKAAARVVLKCEDAKEGPRAFMEKRKPVWAAPTQVILR
jgi:enoyl-CoA hydratase/carnithine racemase